MIRIGQIRSQCYRMGCSFLTQRRDKQNTIINPRLYIIQEWNITDHKTGVQNNIYITIQRKSQREDHHSYNTLITINITLLLPDTCLHKCLHKHLSILLSLFASLLNNNQLPAFPLTLQCRPRRNHCQLHLCLPSLLRQVQITNRFIVMHWLDVVPVL